MIVVRVLHTVVASIVIVVTLIPLAILAGIFGDRPAADFVTRLWCRIVLLCAGARLEVRELAPLDPAKSYVFVSNHTSNMDVPAIVAASRVPVRFVAKKELRPVPIFGWAAHRAGHVFIDRRDSTGATRAIAGRMARGLSGIALFFFAEGTRSTTEEMLPFKKGAAVVALQSGLDCVPIAIAGAREVLKPKSTFLFRPGRIAVVFGPPVPIAGHTLDDRDRLVAEQRAGVEAALVVAKSLVQA